MNRVMRSLAMVGMLASMTLVSCSDRNRKALLPASSGKPYELLVVADNGVWQSHAGSVVNRVLTADAKGLPQPEPQFRVSRIPMTAYKSAFTLFRNILILQIDSSMPTQTRCSYECDMNAAPQIVVRVKAPHIEALADYLLANGGKIASLFNKAERNRVIADLRRQKPTKLASKTREMFGCTILLPQELDVCKEAEGFLWFSSSYSNAMNICLYRYPIEGDAPLSVDSFVQRRNAILGRNIPGSSPESTMQTVNGSVISRIARVAGGSLYEMRGLWQMKGDLMGGPFVAHLHVDTLRNEILVAEGFVYAPSKKKLPLVRRLEASLSTLQLPHNSIN